MNQHKDLLYRQKYATYQLNNRTFSTQNTKISARSLAISYICFQVRIVKKGGKSHTINYYGKIWWLPHPRPPTRALYAKLQREKLQFSITPDDHLEGPYLLKTLELPGALPLDPNRMRRIVCFRHTHKIGLLAIIYNSFFSSFWSVL